MSEMYLADVLQEYEDGNAAGWQSEFAWLWTEDTDRMAALTRDIAENGIKEPVLLGPDGSIWNGHHRIAAAVALGFDRIPVTHGGEGND